MVADRRGKTGSKIIGRKPLDAFAAAFTEDVVLEASVLPDPITGPSGIRSVFSATAAIYETIGFTHETTQGSKTYLEWEGKALGGLTAAGVTVLTRNATGKIESVRLMHRPLPMVLAFSAELARRLEGKLDPEPISHQT